MNQFWPPANSLTQLQPQQTPFSFLGQGGQGMGQLQPPMVPQFLREAPRFGLAPIGNAPGSNPYSSLSTAGNAGGMGAGALNQMSPYQPQGLNYGQPSLMDLSFGLPGGGAAPSPLLDQLRQDQFASPVQGQEFGQFQRGGDFLPIQDAGAVPPPTTPGMSTQDMLGFGLGAATLGLGLWDAKSQIDLGKGQLGVARDTLDLKKRMYADRKGAADAVQFAPR